MIVIERLRALEKKMSATSASARLELNAAERRAQSIPSPTAEHADAMDKIAMGWLRVHMVEMWSSELRDIIAELGQEVGAVAPVSFAVELADGTLGALGWIDYAKFEHVKNMGTLANGARYVFAYRTSPAHTSEARDAVADATEDLVAAARVALDALIEHGDASQTDLAVSLRNYDAAMRQEGGSDE